MARKLGDIGDQHRLAARRHGPAHAPPDRDAHAGGLALERPQHQFVAAAQIEPGPIEVGQAVIDQRRHVGEIGDPIALACEQRGQLHRQIAVSLCFVVGHADFRPWARG